MTESQTLQSGISKLLEIDKELEQGYELKDEQEMILSDILSKKNEEITTALKVLKDLEHRNHRTFQDIVRIEEASKYIFDFSSKLREDQELELFYSKGNFLDLDKLEQIYKDKNLKKVFPKFNFKEYRKIIENPILEIDFLGQTIHYDRLVVKKLLILLTQMIFNEMDIYICNCGKEGSGKSCWSSQLLLWFYTVLNKMGLIDYEYNITRMFFSSIMSMLNEMDIQNPNDYFRIMTLDEANELNRQNFRDQDPREFKYDMRVSRKMLRIIMLNMQQIGEMDISISLSRLNLIFDCQMENDTITGMLKKGIIDTYLIPRGNFIYSQYWKKNIYRIDILNTLSKKLDRKKDYYISLPKELMIHQFKFENKWGFDKEEYDKYIKKENKKRRLANGVKTTELVCYWLYRKVPDFKKWGTFDLTQPSEKAGYSLLKKWFKGVKNIFNMDEQKLQRYDAMARMENNDENRTRKDESFNEEQEEDEEIDDLTPNKFKEEVDFIQEKPKTFYRDANK